MADKADGSDGRSDVYIYMGGRAPQHVINVIIHESVDTIERHAFCDNPNLRYVKFHKGVETVGREAFMNCRSIRGIQMPGVKIVGVGAFTNCKRLKDIQFGKKLEIIEFSAFYGCISLKCVIIPAARTIEVCAFNHCTALTHVQLPEELETVGAYAFWACNLKRIATPMIYDDKISDSVFDSCRELSTVDLVGSDIHKTISHLHMDCWRYDMYQDIHRINMVLPHTSGKTKAIRQWMDSVTNRLVYYRGAHYQLTREAMTILELALWKAKLDDSEEGGNDKIDSVDASARQEAHIRCGASVVIKNVLPFLKLR
jgi:hypothetical protein